MKLNRCAVALIGISHLLFAPPSQAQDINQDFGLKPAAPKLEHQGEQGAETILNYDGAPIDVRLKPGLERRLVFPAPVMVGVQNGVAPQLQIQNVDRTVFLEAVGDIEHARILVRHIDETQTYVLDVTTNNYQTRHTALIINPDVEVAVTEKPKPVTPRMRMKKRRGYTVYSHYVRLTRFAAQQVYGPARLAREDLGVSVVKELDTVTSIPILRGDRVEAKPIAAWTDGVYSVTALKLRNQTDSTVVLDPRDLRGRWLSATFHANSLGRAGDSADTTAVYLISHEPFDQALGAVR